MIVSASSTFTLTDADFQAITLQDITFNATGSTLFQQVHLALIHLTTELVVNLDNDE